MESSEIKRELDRLGDAAVDIAQITDQQKRWEGGWWLNSQLTDLDDKIGTWPNDQLHLDFMAIVKILLDVIFRDAVEDASDLASGLILPDDSFVRNRYGNFRVL